MQFIVKSLMTDPTAFGQKTSFLFLMNIPETDEPLSVNTSCRGRSFHSSSSYRQLDKTCQGAWIQKTEKKIPTCCYLIPDSTFFFLVYWSPTPAKNNGASCSLSAAHQTGSYKNKSLSSFNLNFESINPNSFRQTSKIQFMYILSTSCT